MSPSEPLDELPTVKGLDIMVQEKQIDLQNIEVVVIPGRIYLKRAKNIYDRILKLQKKG